MKNKFELRKSRELWGSLFIGSIVGAIFSYQDFAKFLESKSALDFFKALFEFAMPVYLTTMATFSMMILSKIQEQLGLLDWLNQSI